MAEETLAGNTPIIPDRQAQQHSETRPATDRKVEAKKAAANSAARGGDKKKKLYVHLLIGFLMVLLVVAGYSILGPSALVSAEPAANHFTNVSTQAPSALTVDYSQQMNDMAAMQVQMDEITRQMNALQAMNMSGTPYQGSSTTYNTSPGTGSSQITAGQSQAEVMMNELMMMMNQMNNMSTQPGATSPAVGSSEHVH